ncbi:MAG: hypothetical protein AAF696_24030 [Bacteroidota bacterium]
MQDHSKTYYNGDLGLVSQTGVMLFLPSNALRKGKETHEGNIWVDVAEYNKLKSSFAPDEGSLIQFIQNPRDLFVIRSQKDSLVSDLHIANGKEILLFLPYHGKKAEDYELMTSPKEWMAELFPDGFMNSELHLSHIGTKDFSEENVARILYHAKDKSEKRAAQDFLEKEKSFKELQAFLSSNWELAQRRFKASQEDYLDEGDTPREIAYYVLSMNYLRDPPADSTLIYAFRDHLGEEAFVIMDWTGSMYQFRAELVEFLKHNTQEKKLKYLSFYNDLYCDFPRAAGNFEGIYTYEDSFPTNTQASQLMKECESNGSGGGELEENDLEAIITSIERVKTKHYKEIALVIDNNAPPKDMLLLPKIKLPKDMVFNIFVCRANSLEEVKADYLEVARKFGGNIILVSSEGIVKKSIYDIDAEAI